MHPPSRLAVALSEGGLPEDEIPGKLALLASAEQAFARFASGSAERGWWVPGRIEVFGKHTDYAGGRSLLAAVPRGFILLAARRSDSQVRVLEAASGAEATIDSAAIPADSFDSPIASVAPGFRRYVEVVVRRLARNFPGAALGADLAFASDLPQAAGLSSSSALTVGMATALSRLSGLEERPEWRAAIRTREDLAGYFACVENGADFGTLAGSAGVGALTGSEDQTAILSCRAGTLSLCSFLPVVHHEDVALPAGWRFVVATSGVVAEKAGNARERYNRAARQVAALLDLWNRARSERFPEPSLAAALASEPGAEGALRALLDEKPELHVRLTHFLREDARAPQAMRAFRDADEAALGTLSAASQRDAEELLGNQIPETVALAALARRLGAFAASSFGAGFGGGVWALVRSPGADEADDFARRWIGAYRELYPRHLGADAFATSLGPGLLELFRPV